jgi:hypothetical protein
MGKSGMWQEISPVCNVSSNQFTTHYVYESDDDFCYSITGDRCSGIFFIKSQVRYLVPRNESFKTIFITIHDHRWSSKHIRN